MDERSRLLNNAFIGDLRKWTEILQRRLG
jgi:hypothetical protein